MIGIEAHKRDAIRGGKKDGQAQGKANLIKASTYANSNLRYHLDERHKLTEDGYSKTADCGTGKQDQGVRWVQARFADEPYRHLGAPCVSLESCHSPRPIGDIPGSDES